MIEVEHVSIAYDDVRVVEDVSLCFASGKISGMIGPNGAGKSTLINAMVGLIDAENGAIRYEQGILKAAYARIKANLGYAPENAELLPYLRGREFLQLIGHIRGINDVQEEVNTLLEMLNLYEQKDKLIVHYSHGMRQKMSTAAALLGKPQYIILDEALNGFDILTLHRIHGFLKTLAEEGRTIVLASHDVAMIERWCDPLIFMHRGRVVGNFPAHAWLEQKESAQARNSDPYLELFQ